MGEGCTTARHIVEQALHKRWTLVDQSTTVAKWLNVLSTYWTLARDGLLSGMRRAVAYGASYAEERPRTTVIHSDLIDGRVMKTLVAGAPGAIGSPLVKQLLQEGHDVISMAQNNEATRQLQQKGAPVRIGLLPCVSISAAERRRV